MGDDALRDGGCGGDPESTAFLETTSEDASMNQYWYSAATISAYSAEVLACLSEGGGGRRAAFLSTPSVYFALTEEQRNNSFLLEYDDQWSFDRGYTYYDFRTPENVPKELCYTVDIAVIDPPFITPEVWEQYAKTTRLLLRPGGRLLCTTTFENGPLLHDLLQVSAVQFRPSIPNLPYQYSTYCSAGHSLTLDRKNPEIDAEGDVVPMAPMFGHAATSAGAPILAEELPIRTNIYYQQLQSDAGEGCSGLRPEPPPAPLDFGPVHDALVRWRERLTDTKRRCADICKLAEAGARLRVRLRRAEEATAAGGAAVPPLLAESLEAAAAACRRAADELRSGVNELDSGGELDAVPGAAAGVRCAEVVQAVEALADAASSDSVASKKAVKELNALSARTTQRIFLEQKTLLAQIKEMKKEARARERRGA